MRYSYLIVILILLIASNLFSQWELQNPSPTPNDLTKVHFINKDVGWIFGSHGTIYKTENGGETWYKQNSGYAIDISSISIIDESLGFIAGDRKILKTTNGGDTWNGLYPKK